MQIFPCLFFWKVMQDGFLHICIRLFDINSGKLRDLIQAIVRLSTARPPYTITVKGVPTVVFQIKKHRSCLEDVQSIPRKIVFHVL